MKQIFQSIKDGNTNIIEAPAPNVSVGCLIIHATTSVISSGTERMLVDFGKASYLQKARQQPQKVKVALDKIRTDGLFCTVDAIKSKLIEQLAMGYCHVGVVGAVGPDCVEFKPGDRVISNAPHADVVRVSKNLCVQIPDNVDDETASFTVLASIALQGLRLASPTLGEAFVVTGVGLIGLLAVQLLKAHGCRVLAIDLDDNKLALARQFGAETCHLSRGEDPVATGMAFSRGRGVDAVIITASTQSNDPVKQAARMSRKRGRIVLVGVAGLELSRADFYEKELTFQVSCSYGPGRYASEYEEKGLDYPIGFVRWTEQRNFEAVLDMMSSNQLDVKPLITHRFEFEDAASAYQVLTDDHAALGIVLQYKSDVGSRQIKEVNLHPNVHFDAKRPVLGIIGAGNYASRVLIPAFKAAGAQCHTIATSGGINGVIHGAKAGFMKASVDIDTILMDNSINTLVIATRHDSHADFVTKALAVGKHIFVEKPLAIDLEGLASVEGAYHTAIFSGKKNCLLVGFNRRFAPHVQKMQTLLKTVKEPKSFIMTVNAGHLPADHWTQDWAVGGGRIIGEACHFIDLMRYLAGAEIISVQARCMSDKRSGSITEDKVAITLAFADGSFGTIHYLANGATGFPKERIEVFAAGRVLQLDNFRKLKGFGWPGFRKMNLWRQDKGQAACVKAFLLAIEKGEDSPIAIEEIFEVARVSIHVAQLIRQQA